MDNKVTQKYVDYYQSIEADINQKSSEIVNSQRQQAIDNFKAWGIPNQSIEAYKYTNLEQVFDNNFDMSLSQKALDIDVESIFKCDVLKLDAHLALTAKGQYASKELLINKDEGIVVCSFKEAAKKHKDLFKKYYNQIAKDKEDGSVALNTALAYDGVFIYIPKNKIIDKPIQVVNLQVDGSLNNAVQLRHLIIAEENTEAKIIFCDDSLTSNQHLSNTVTEVFVDKNARIEINKMQNEHNDSLNISSTFVKQLEKSVVTSNTISLLGGVIRNNLYMEMAGEHCEANAYGISLIDRKQKFDTHTYIHHAFPNCNSNQLYKNIIDDSGIGVFSGTVLVDKDAQKTNAFQSNNNIILTKTAKMNTKPQLIIYADDVKCSHGATVGQLDESAMFYMRARGIEERDARMLLMYAFAHDVVKKMSIQSLRENTEDLIRKRLSGELSLCRNCSSRILVDSSL
jgi:Fe-S cluster assembly protein SufD